MTTRPFEYLVSLGSNVAPEASVASGLALLRGRFEVVAVSPVYDVEAVGVENQPRFRNLALRLRTDLLPRSLREACRRIEEACGRRPGAARLAPRTLDLDVVFAAPSVPGAGGLPHPDLLAQAYVLCPAADVWPEAVHPAMGATLATLVGERFPGWAARHRLGQAWEED